jgi:uncharacterized protein
LLRAGYPLVIQESTQGMIDTVLRHRQSTGRKCVAAVRVGLISDTHDLLRPQAIDFLRGSDFIIHAGDICDSMIIDELTRIAPLTVVRGNNDRGEWADVLPDTELIKIGGIFIHVIHDLAQLDIDPNAAGVQVVVSGHSHKPAIERRGGVTFVNPGSAGPRRFKLPISVAELIIAGLSVSARLVELTNECGAVK